MKKIYLSLLILTGLLIIFNAETADAQIKIGTNGATIAPSSLLELESANQGLLLPRMADTVAINALAPPNGMLIYLTKAPAVGLYVRKVTGWEYLTGSLGGAGNFSSLTVSGTVTAGSFTGPLNGNATSANTAINATNSANSTVVNDLATPAPVYPTFVTTTPGNSQLRTATTKLSFIPNTGILTATGFAGPLTGDVTGNATSATNATNASNTDIVNEVASGAVHYPTFVSGTAGNLPQMVSNPGLNYVPSTGTLSATRFAGTFVGNASTATNAVTTTITNDNASAATVYPTFVTASAGNMGQRTADARLTFVPATGNLTASIFTSTVPTGSAPLVVASNTTVANLTSTNTINTAVTDDVATATPVYPTFVTTTTGFQNQRTASSRLSFIPATGALTANSFVGPLNGNATSANTSINATNSANSNITDDITTPAVAYPVFVNASPGNQPLHVGPSNLSYVPSTGILTARGFVGPLTGNVTGTATASVDAQNTVNIRITDDVISNTPLYPTLVTGNTGPLPARVSSTKLSFVPQTGELSATLFRGDLSGNASSATNVTGTVAISNGGTGAISKSAAFDALSPLTTAGDLIYMGPGSATRLPVGTPTQFLRAGSTPVWSAVDLSTADVTGVLTSNKGGTGVNNAFTLTLTGANIALNAPVASTLTLPATGTVATTSNTLNNFAITTSAQLATVVSDETGTGTVVFSTSPTLTTPTLGVASATRINDVTITDPGTGATLALANNSTLSTVGAFTTTLTTTGNTNVSLPTSTPSGSVLVAALTGSQTIDFPSTANGQSSNGPVTITVTGAAIGDPVSLGVSNNSMALGGSYMAWVSAANTVTVRFSNVTSAPVDPASETFNVKVFK